MITQTKLVILGFFGFSLATLFGCVHAQLTMEHARDLGCEEACAKRATNLQKDGSLGYYVGDNTCECRFDDGSIGITCLRPVFETCL